MNMLRNSWFSALTATVASLALFVATTEVAVANGLDGLPYEDAAIAWQSADHQLPEPVPLAFIDVEPSETPASAVPPDVPEVVAAPAAGGMTKAMLVLMGLIFLVILLAVGLLVLFIIDLTTDFDLFPQN